MNATNKSSSTGKRGCGSPRSIKYRKTLAKNYNLIADSFEFESLPWIKDPWERGRMKEQIAKYRDEAIRVSVVLK